MVASRPSRRTSATPPQSASLWLSALVVALFWVYEGGNMALAVPFDAPAALHDARSRWAGDVAGRARPGGVPPLVDVPASEANRLLYDDG